MMPKRIFVVIVLGLLLIPAISTVVDASSYHYSGKAYVSSKYRYVSFTPQKIIIKTNARYEGSPFHSSGNIGLVMWKSLTINLYSWSDLDHKWIVQDRETYYNKFNSLGKVTDQKFTCKVYTYYKHWYDRFRGRHYIKFVITIPKDKDLMHHSSGKTKISVTVRGEGSRVYWGSMAFDKLSMTISGTSSYYVKPTPYDKYKRYWGYSASAQEYNQLYASDYQQGTDTYSIPIYEKYTFADFVMLFIAIFSISTVIVTAYVYRKKYR